MNTLQVRLKDGTIGVPDKFIVGKDEYNTQAEAESAIKQQVIEDIQSWMESNVNSHDYFALKEVSDSFYNLDKADVLEFIELLTQLT
jgi:hypothetical protein